MPHFIPLEEMERAHTAYNDVSEELARALDSVKASGRGSKEQLDNIDMLSKRCDELLHKYLEAYRKYYGENKPSYS